jgi:hypothetical protein
MWGLWRKTGQAFSSLANTEQMNELNLRGRLLTTLFRRGQANETIDVIGLARSCAVSVADVLVELDQLACAGLVGRLTDARPLPEVRLTMAGLACATALARLQAAEPAKPNRRSSLPLARARRAA